MSGDKAQDTNRRHLSTYRETPVFESYQEINNMNL